MTKKKKESSSKRRKHMINRKQNIQIGKKQRIEETVLTIETKNVPISINQSVRNGKRYIYISESKPGKEI